MADNDSLGNRMKAYEAHETERRFTPMLPIYARIDGRGFSNFTRGMRRPYDEHMIHAMVQTTKYLVDHTHAKIGYCQSDEISLTWHAPHYESSVFFDGRVAKMTSVLAGMATAAFTRAVLDSTVEDFRAYADRLPHFDARVIVMPTQEEVANMFLWRNLDATKNAISMAAQHYFSHKTLHGVNGAQMQEMLFREHGINFNDYPEAFKRGTFVKRVVTEKTLTEEELARIPEAKRPSPDMKVLRTSVVPVEMPIFSKVVNRVGVIFNGEDAVTEEQLIDPETAKMYASLEGYSQRAN